MMFQNHLYMLILTVISNLFCRTLFLVLIQKLRIFGEYGLFCESYNMGLCESNISESLSFMIDITNALCFR